MTWLFAHPFSGSDMVSDSLKINTKKLDSKTKSSACTEELQVQHHQCRSWPVHAFTVAECVTSMRGFA